MENKNVTLTKEVLENLDKIFTEADVVCNAAAIIACGDMPKSHFADNVVVKADEIIDLANDIFFSKKRYHADLDNNTAYISYIYEKYQDRYGIVDIDYVTAHYHEISSKILVPRWADKYFKYRISSKSSGNILCHKKPLAKHNDNESAEIIKKNLQDKLSENPEVFGALSTLSAALAAVMSKCNGDATIAETAEMLREFGEKCKETTKLVNAVNEAKNTEIPNPPMVIEVLATTAKPEPKKAKEDDIKDMEPAKPKIDMMDRFEKEISELGYAISDKKPIPDYGKEVSLLTVTSKDKTKFFNFVADPKGEFINSIQKVFPAEWDAAVSNWRLYPAFRLDDKTKDPSPIKAILENNALADQKYTGKVTRKDQVNLGQYIDLKNNSIGVKKHHELLEMIKSPEWSAYINALNAQSLPIPTFRLEVDKNVVTVITSDGHRMFVITSTKEDKKIVNTVTKGADYDNVMASLTVVTSAPMMDRMVSPALTAVGSFNPYTAVAQ